MHIFWISGWGIPHAQMLQCLNQKLPQHTHHIHHPVAQTAHLLKMHPRGFDSIAGYSLGALLILIHLEHLRDIPTYLFAPFLDLKQESMLGGRIPKTHLKATRKSLIKDPMQTLTSFHTFAQTHPASVFKALPYPLEDLIWGLDLIISSTIKFNNAPNITSFIGENDRLIDSQKLQNKIPGLNIIKNANHSLESLVESPFVDTL